MLIRTFVPLLVAGVFKYVASRVLMHQFEQMLEEAVRKRDQNIDNTETPQSET